MFRLKSSESLARFLYQKTLHNNSMAYSIGYYDPCSHLNKAFSQYPCDRGSYLSFPFISNLVYANVFGVSRKIGLGQKVCGFSTSGSSRSSDCSKFFVRASLWPRGFASDLEQGNGDATLVKVDDGGLNGSPATPLGFRDQRFSEKIVVAVDVDEGMYAIVYVCSYPFLFYDMSSILYNLILLYGIMKTKSKILIICSGFTV